MAIEKERAAAEAVWIEQANLLAVEIARRLVARLDGPVVSNAFLDWLLQDIRGFRKICATPSLPDGACSR